MKISLLLPVCLILLGSLVACRDKAKHAGDQVSMKASHEVQGAMRLQRSRPLKDVVLISFVEGHRDLVWQVQFGGRQFTEIVYSRLPVVPADGKIGPRQSIPDAGLSPRMFKPGEKIEFWLEYPEDKRMAPSMGFEKWEFVVPEIGGESVCRRLE